MLTAHSLTAAHLLPTPSNLQATQSSPYWRADVELLIDAEEQQQFEPLALQALESVQAGLKASSGFSNGGLGAEAAAAAVAAVLASLWLPS